MNNNYLLQQKFRKKLETPEKQRKLERLELQSTQKKREIRAKTQNDPKLNTQKQDQNPQNPQEQNRPLTKKQFREIFSPLKPVKKIVQQQQKQYNLYRCQSSNNNNPYRIPAFQQNLRNGIMNNHSQVKGQQSERNHYLYSQDIPKQNLQNKQIREIESARFIGNDQQQHLIKQIKNQLSMQQFEENQDHNNNIPLYQHKSLLEMQVQSDQKQYMKYNKNNLLHESAISNHKRMKTENINHNNNNVSSSINMSINNTSNNDQQLNSSNLHRGEYYTQNYVKKKPRKDSKSRNQKIYSMDNIKILNDDCSYITDNTNNNKLENESDTSNILKDSVKFGFTFGGSKLEFEKEIQNEEKKENQGLQQQLQQQEYTFQKSEKNGQENEFISNQSNNQQQSLKNEKVLLLKQIVTKNKSKQSRNSQSFVQESKKQIQQMPKYHGIQKNMLKNNTNISNNQSFKELKNEINDIQQQNQSYEKMILSQKKIPNHEVKFNWANISQNKQIIQQKEKENNENETRFKRSKSSGLYNNSKQSQLPFIKKPLNSYQKNSKNYPLYSKTLKKQNNTLQQQQQQQLQQQQQNENQLEQTAHFFNQQPDQNMTKKYQKQVVQPKKMQGYYIQASKMKIEQQQQQQEQQQNPQQYNQKDNKLLYQNSNNKSNWVNYNYNYNQSNNYNQNIGIYGSNKKK